MTHRVKRDRHHPMHHRAAAPSHAPRLALLAALWLPACGPTPADPSPQQAAREAARRDALKLCPSGRACVEQARALIRTEGVEGVEHGLALLDAGCALDEAQACQMAGRWRLMAPRPDDARDALALAALSRACALGAPASCAAQANMLRFGRGAAPDDAAATAALARGRALYPSPHPMLDTMHQDYVLAVVLPLVRARCPAPLPALTLRLDPQGHLTLPDPPDTPQGDARACAHALLSRALWLPARATTSRTVGAR